LSPVSATATSAVEVKKDSKSRGGAAGSPAYFLFGQSGLVQSA
jgi:hypothetical protein